MLIKRLYYEKCNSFFILNSVFCVLFASWWTCIVHNSYRKYFSSAWSNFCARFRLARKNYRAPKNVTFRRLLVIQYIYYYYWSIGHKQCTSFHTHSVQNKFNSKIRFHFGTFWFNVKSNFYFHLPYVQLGTLVWATNLGSKFHQNVISIISPGFEISSLQDVFQKS